MENYSNGFPEERDVQRSHFYGSQKETINFSLLHRCSSSSLGVSGFGAFGISGQWSISCTWMVEMFFQWQQKLSREFNLFFTEREQDEGTLQD